MTGPSPLFRTSLFLLACAVLLMTRVLLGAPAHGVPSGDRPNILWISCEDTSPWLGFCGESYARTPNLDRLAKEGVSYTNAFASAPVCSPCRSAIITGIYATTLGTQRLRSDFPIPTEVRGFPSHLRAAGYYTSNNAKTDYNTSAEKRLIAESWNVCGPRAHWMGRSPGQPFFAIFNLMETHQGKAFGSDPVPGVNPADRHDPAKAPLPPYYPDTAEARRTIARVHDNISAMDAHAGRILAEIESAGLAENTIIFFWSDHGQGIPRGKRTLWDTGLRVPLVIRFPENYRHLAPASPGARCTRLVQLLDLGPTLLSLLDLPIPEGLQGCAFLGRRSDKPRTYVAGARDRVDEVMDVSRSVRDNRYLYIRHYLPDLSHNTPEGYSDQLALRRELAYLAVQRRLEPQHLSYAGSGKPREMLFDCEADPWQLRNLAEDPSMHGVLERMRGLLRRWQEDTRDLGFMSEWEAERLCSNGRSLREMAMDERNYPLRRTIETAELVGAPRAAAEQLRRLEDSNPHVRYWAALGIRIAMGLAPQERGANESDLRAALQRARNDGSTPVKIEVLGILAHRFSDQHALGELATLINNSSLTLSVQAARTLQLMGESARPAIPDMRKALERKPPLYLEFSLRNALESLGVSPTP